jgi:two-component system NtrC family sensor kinase
VNQLACQRLGYSREELLAIGAAGINQPQFRDGLTRQIEQIRKLGSLAFESAYTRRDGTIIPVELNNRVIEYAGVPAILSIARDLTDRKQAETRLRHYADEQTVLYEIALKLNAQLNLDELLHAIVEQAVALLGAKAGGIYLYDTTRDALVMTLGVDVYREYIGMEIKPGEELSGRAFQNRRIMKADDYPAWERRTAGSDSDNPLRPVIAVPLAGKHAVLGVLFVAGDESRREFDDHDARLVELFAAQAAIALENAQLYNAQQEQYRRLQESQTRLIQSEKMSALGRLVASIAHEINNPLQAVQGCLSLVREGIEEARPIGRQPVTNMLEDLSVAASEVTRIAGIVQRLRDFYRPARPGVQVTDVNAIVDAVLALAAKQLQHSHVVVERTQTPADTPITVKTNADQLKQVILNLVLNAIDAMPDGGVLRISADIDSLNVADARSSAVRLMFTDTGHGIPAENLARVFEPFFTTKENGSGLGLSISYDLVKALGGELSVESDVGAGATFTIRLPVDTVA